MEQNFIEMTKQIKQRRSEIISVLREEEEAMRRAVQKLRRDYESLIKSELDGLKNDMTNHASELFRDLITSNQSLENTVRKKIETLWYLLPVAWIIGVGVGVIFTDLYFTQPQVVVIDSKQIATDSKGVEYYPLTQIPNIKIKE